MGKKPPRNTRAKGESPLRLQTGVYPDCWLSVSLFNGHKAVNVKLFDSSYRYTLVFPTFQWWYHLICWQELPICICSAAPCRQIPGCQHPCALQEQAGRDPRGTPSAGGISRSFSVLLEYFFFHNSLLNLFPVSFYALQPTWGGIWAHMIFCLLCLYLQISDDFKWQPACFDKDIENKSLVSSEATR